MFATSSAVPGQRFVPIAVTILVLGVAGSWFWSRHQESQDLLALPNQERQALYQRTLETLESICARATGPELNDYCHDQAQFIARFPECGTKCAAVCQRLAQRPTK
jgi:cytochrome b pre-mRNA-processing protein 3